MSSLPYITRVGPSPTGMFHLGTARTALFNYLTARASNGKFILRIDDTDVERNKQEYTDIILQSLDWLGLEYDEIHYQSKRTEIYSKAAESLLRAGKAYYPSGVAALCLKPPTALPNSFLDTIAGEIPITDTNLAQIDGRAGKLVLMRNNGTPTYHFASVVDDYYMGINYIIRGVDHITNSPKQIAIWDILSEINTHKISDKIVTTTGPISSVLNYPQFAHIGLINKDKKKLSKRDNAASLLWYRENGYSSIAILNFLLRMGWGSKEDTNKLLTKQEMIDVFPSGRMRAAPSNFDQSKLDYYNKQSRKLS